MKYNYRIYYNDNIIAEGETSGRGTRTDQQGEVELIRIKEATKRGINLLTDRMPISLHSTTAY